MEFTKEEHKELVKEAIKEWLDEKAADFGKWTIKWMASACFGFSIYFLATNGYLK